jgi:uncharacterized membrane protein YkvA (DUF1232 family)
MQSLGKFARAILAALVGTGYLLSPVDAVPDVILGIGWIDDLIVVALAVFYIRRLFNQLSSRPAPQLRPVAIPQLPPR